MNTGLARETAERFLTDRWNLEAVANNEKAELTARIQSALDHAVNEDREQNLSILELDYINKLRPIKQQPRGEKWTVFESYGNWGVKSGSRIVVAGLEEFQAWDITDAHNASIGADAGERDTKRLDWLGEKQERLRIENYLMAHYYKGQREAFGQVVNWMKANRKP